MVGPAGIMGHVTVPRVMGGFAAANAVATYTIEQRHGGVMVPVGTSDDTGGTMSRLTPAGMATLGAPLALGVGGITAAAMGGLLGRPGTVAMGTGIALLSAAPGIGGLVGVMASDMRNSLRG